MNQKIKVILIDTFGWITSICIIFFFFTLWLYSYNDIESPLKEAWSLTISLLSALATLGAAIIAAKLFNDWREQEEYNQRSTQINKVIMNAEDFEKIINNIKLPLARYNGKIMEKLEFFNFLLESYSKIEDQSSNIFNNLNHLSEIGNKGFSSEVLFISFQEEYQNLSNKLEVIILKISEIEPQKQELYELRDAMNDIKEFINSRLIRTLRSGLRKI
ncbi:hypothetical protein [Acinetobacter baumannii]|uniref:hypothetical protein n=1 Tax=Acinetobacter baumannii TaxID=470 RepID=UPI0002D0E87A|nr:hypothetical protein [Acinetobacter baumannii]ENW33965.1 hypothetical protein F922_02527 [Acinetobacter baumannii NIPH 201]MDV7475327.1 hypothetical protein [Acinetobacter baumannii]HDX6152962.1 hypothetical protein [Acinetobacter baumannii]